MPNPRILIVDDDEELRFCISKYLTSRIPCDVEQCVNGQEALAVLEKNKYDLVVLDKQMPGVDGFSVLYNLRKKNDDTAVVMVTVIEDEHTIKAIGDLGAVYVPKPMNLNAFLLIITNALKKKGFVF